MMILTLEACLRDKNAYRYVSLFTEEEERREREKKVAFTASDLDLELGLDDIIVGKKGKKTEKATDRKATAAC